MGHYSITQKSPVSLRLLPSMRMTHEGELKQIISAARLAQVNWQAMGFERRAALMKQAARTMLIRRHEVLDLITEEIGKPFAESLLAEAVGPLQYLKDWIAVARPWLKPRALKIPLLAFPKKKGRIDLLPRGVVGIICPWNFPLGNFFKPVFAALLSGNAVVIKPSEYSSRTAHWFAERMQEFLPQGVVQLVLGDGSVGEKLILSGIDALTFTGSYATGRRVAQVAAEALIPCSFELGGKDAAVILEDCDWDRTLAGVMYWALHNAGQACGDIERIYIHDAIADSWSQRLKAAVCALRTHDHVEQDVGPCAHLAQLKIIESQVQDALAQGAQLLCGGRRTQQGFGYEPTVLDHCHHGMQVMQEPTFGVVLPLMRFKNDLEAVHWVNDCSYGLNASVWSKNRLRAQWIAEQLQVGTVYINNHAFTGALPSAPWTGVKKSGYGVANSVFALQHYTRPRTYVVDEKRTVDAWWYPLDAVAKELGHCLAEAQLGKVFSAVKIPFLMAIRQKTVLQFIRHPHKIKALLESNYGKESFLQRLRYFKYLKLIPWCHDMLNRCFPKLTQFELKVGVMIMESLFFGLEKTPLSGLSSEAAQTFLKDLDAHFPTLSRLFLKFSIWFVELSALFTHLKVFHLLQEEKKIAYLIRLETHRWYGFRQLVLMFKLNGSLFYLSTHRFQKQITLKGRSLRSSLEEMTL